MNGRREEEYVVGKRLNVNAQDGGEWQWLFECFAARCVSDTSALLCYLSIVIVCISSLYVHVFGVYRFQPASLVERIQAIAQNVSNMAIRVEQILQNSMVQGRGTVSLSSCFQLLVYNTYE